MALSCKDQGKQQSQQYYSRPNVSIIEMRNPETVIAETLGFSGEILAPKVYSPKDFVYKNPALKNTTLLVLKDLVIAEKVARRQYDELLMFPEIKGFESDLLYIRNDEHEHEKILECILQRIGPGAATVNLSRLFTPKEREILPTWVTKPSDFKALHLTKQLGEMYEVILDRFGDEEDKAVRSYEDLLVKVQQSIEALKKSDLAGDAYTSVATPLMELERKVNKHLNEERVHLDVVDALREMFSGMKLGKVS